VVDAQWIPFPGAFFDAVIANHKLFHIPDLQKARASFFSRRIQQGHPGFGDQV